MVVTVRWLSSFCACMPLLQSKLHKMAMVGFDSDAGVHYMNNDCGRRATLPQWHINWMIRTRMIRTRMIRTRSRMVSIRMVSVIFWCNPCNEIHYLKYIGFDYNYNNNKYRVIKE